ncbi:MAG: hypothetical protein OEU26_00060 [Candidatus Tectomicrobia bacterium]|nr:hypothetical protein [Candidatus Tectomicrobia bacterium]
MYRMSGTVRGGNGYVFTGILILLVLMPPALVSAHRSALCDGVKPVHIFMQKNGIVQIQVTEPITGVYPGTPQENGFIEYDVKRPEHLFRIDGAKMTSQQVIVHVNTTAHQCLLRVRTRAAHWDSIVTLNYPPSARDLQLGLPAHMQESPVRQMWFAMWLNNKDNAPPGVKVEKYESEIRSWTEGLKVVIHYRYTLPGFTGFTHSVTNVSDSGIEIYPSELFDPTRPIHSVSITDTLGGQSIFHPYGILKPGDNALLHIVYKKKGGR